MGHEPLSEAVSVRVAQVRGRSRHEAFLDDVRTEEVLDATCVAAVEDAAGVGDVGGLG